jgi:SAM-dependent methyltransferase
MAVVVPATVKARTARAVRSPALRRRVRPVRWGSFATQTPRSTHYGADRGTPVDRVYIDAFFARHSTDIHGRALEVGASRYTRRFGSAVDTIDVVDIAVDNRDATIVADLADVGSLPAARFDCIIVPQTLQYVGDVEPALTNCYAALAPGGVLLVTVPAIARLDHDLATVERWRFLPLGFERQLARACPGATLTVGADGNLLAATAFLHGIAAEELDEGDLDRADPLYPVVTWARVEKPRA